MTHYLSPLFLETDSVSSLTFTSRFFFFFFFYITTQMDAVLQIILKIH